jgi:hypothetical protein
MTHDHDAADTPEEIRVAEALQQIRAGIRQRQAELAALNLDKEKPTSQRFRDLHAHAYIQARPFTSQTPIIGRLIVFVREMWCSVATKWYMHPILRQQNTLNQAVVQTLQEISETQNDTQQRLDQIEQQLISMDRDTTLLARKIAEGEYRVRQGELETSTLARRLDKLEHDQGSAE